MTGPRLTPPKAPKTDGELKTEFDNLSQKAKELRAIAIKARKKPYYPASTFSRTGGAPNLKKVFSGLEAKYKEVLDSPLSATAKAEVKAVADEIANAAKLADQLGVDVLHGHDELLSETRKQFEDSCARIQTLQTAAVNGLTAEDSKSPALTTLTGQTDDLKNLKANAQEKLVEDLKRTVEVQDANLSIKAFSPGLLREAGRAQFTWVPAVPHAPDEKGHKLTLKSIKTTGIKPGFYTHNDYGWGMNITEKDGGFHAEILGGGDTGAFLYGKEKNAISDSKMKERVWQAYLFMNPTGKKVPLTFSDSLEKLKEDYNGGQGKRRVWTKNIVKQVNLFLSLAKEKGVPIDLGNYTELLKSRVADGSMKPKDYAKLLKEVHDHNSGLASVEAHERKNLTDNITGKIEEEGAEEKEKRGAEAKAYLDGLRKEIDEPAIAGVDDEKKGEDEEDEPEEERIEIPAGDDAAIYRVEQEIKSVSDKIDSFEELQKALPTAADEKEVKKIAEGLNGLRGELTSKKLEEFRKKIEMWKTLELPPAAKSALMDKIQVIEARLPKVTDREQDNAKLQVESRKNVLLADAKKVPAGPPVVPPAPPMRPDEKKVPADGKRITPGRM